MSDNPFREYTEEEIKQFMGGVFKPISDLILESLAGGSHVNLNVNANASKVQQLEADLDAAKKRIDELETLNRNLTSARDTAVRQRDAAQSTYTIRRTEHEALMHENEHLKSVQRNLEARLRDAEQRAASAKGMKLHPDPHYNKLHKHYTAACNQRDSYKEVVAAQKITIRSLEDDLAELRRSKPTEVKMLVVDGVAWSADDVRKACNTSVERASKINDLTGKLNAITAGTEYIKVGAFHYSESDIRSLLNTIDQLRRNIENLKQTRPTIEVKGKYMTVSQIEGLMNRNLNYAAEIDRLNAIHKRAASTLRGTTASVKRERAKRHELEAQVQALQNEVTRLGGPKMVQTGVSTIEVEPQVVELVIRKPEHTSVIVNNVKVAADMIPDMASNLVQLSTEIEGLRKIIENNSQQLKSREAIIANKDSIIEHKNAEIANRGRRLDNQATTIASQEQRIISLVASEAALKEQLSEKEAKLQSQGIELRLTRGRLNSIQKRGEEPKYETVMKAGKTCMTTDVGIVTVDSEGMRFLADQYHRLRVKIDQLSTFLEEWAKG